MLIPAKICKFLGFLFDTERFAVLIPSDKKKNLLRMTKDMLARDNCQIRHFAAFIGSLISVCPAVQYGLLHTKILEKEKFLALATSGNNFDARMLLPPSCKKDLLWWEAIFSDESQCNHIRSGSFDLKIFSDASLTGWEATCKEKRTHGFSPMTNNITSITSSS